MQIHQYVKKIIGIAIISAAMLPLASNADEAGVPFWYSGQYASFAAVPEAPGLYLPATLYYYNGSASASKRFPNANTITTNVESDSPILLLQPNYAPHKKILYGQLTIGVGVGVGVETTQARLNAQANNVMIDRKDMDRGTTDLYPFANLAWNQRVHNEMIYITGDIPTGSYNQYHLANIGIGHAAIDAGGGYTYFNSTSGLEASVVAGLTRNFVNTRTHYKNGVDSHLDVAGSYVAESSRQVGLVGYVYQQLSGDSGTGAKLGAFKSSVAAIGPEIASTLTIFGHPCYANLRGYYEFWARNRLKGFDVYATLNMPVG